MEKSNFETTTRHKIDYNTVKSNSTGNSSAYHIFGQKLKTLDELQNDLRAIGTKDNFVFQIIPYLYRMTRGNRRGVILMTSKVDEKSLPLQGIQNLTIVLR